MNVQVAVEASTSSTTSNEGTLKIQSIALGLRGGGGGGETTYFLDTGYLKVLETGPTYM